MCIIKYFLDIISPNNDMLDKMHNLFSKFPEIDLAALGFLLVGNKNRYGYRQQLNANEHIAKLQELEKENARLRKIFDVHGIPYIVTEPNVTTKESLQAIFHTDSKLSLQEKACAIS